MMLACPATTGAQVSQLHTAFAEVVAALRA
jgi:hypothetical protein